jgi:hypothetical protein
LRAGFMAQVASPSLWGLISSIAYEWVNRKIFNFCHSSWEKLQLPLWPYFKIFLKIDMVLIWSFHACYFHVNF